MYTDITSKEKPTGGGNPPADHSDTGTVAHREDADKAFQTLCNAFAPDAQDFVRSQLASCLCAVVVQHLEFLPQAGFRAPVLSMARWTPKL